MMRSFPSTIMGCLVFALSVGPVSADVLFEHVGANNPTTEGFTGLLSRPRDHYGAISPDTYDDKTDAWYGIDDQSVDRSGTFLLYRDGLTSAQQSDLVANGWRVTLNLRVVDGFHPDPPQGEDARDVANNLPVFWQLRLPDAGENGLSYELRFSELDNGNTLV